MASPPPARILVRTDVDYRAMDHGAFAAQDDPSRPLPFIRAAQSGGLLRVFEEVFGQGFFGVRARLAEHAAAALAAARGATVTRGVADLDAWLDAPGDEVIYPVDDDDLLHPDLARLAPLPDDADLVVWDWSALGFGPFGSRPAVHRVDQPILFSSNFGVRRSFLRDSFPRGDARRFLADHATAQSLVARALGVGPAEGWDLPEVAMSRELAHPRVRFLGGALSLQLLHPASLSYLVFTARHAELAGRLRELALEEHPPLPESLAWASAAAARHAALLDELARGRSARSVRDSPR